MPELQLLPEVQTSGAAVKLAAIVGAANESPVVTRMMHGWDRKVALSIDGQSYVIVSEGGRASLTEGTLEAANLHFSLSENTLALLMARQLTPLMGKMKGLIQSSGSIVDILRFSSLLSASVLHMFRGYIEKAVPCRPNFAPPPSGM